MKDEDIKKLNIYQKMDLITNEIETVGKNLKVQVSSKASYNAVSERDIIDAVKPIEHKYRVYSYPYDRKIIDNDIVVNKNEYGEKNSFFMRVETIYRFVNIDNGNEFIDIKAYGDGIDTGDKAPGKATTYADKYALMKAYKISTGEDPDEDPSPNKGYTRETKKEVEKPNTTNYRDLVIKYCNDNKIDVNEIAKTYKLNAKSTSKDFEQVYFDLTLFKEGK